jgi:hypothetical protein
VAVQTLAVASAAGIDEGCGLVGQSALRGAVDAFGQVIAMKQVARVVPAGPASMPVVGAGQPVEEVGRGRPTRQGGPDADQGVVDEGAGHRLAGDFRDAGRSSRREARRAGSWIPTAPCGPRRRRPTCSPQERVGLASQVLRPGWALLVDVERRIEPTSRRVVRYRRRRARCTNDRVRVGGHLEG